MTTSTEASPLSLEPSPALPAFRREYLTAVAVALGLSFFILLHYGGLHAAMATLASGTLVAIHFLSLTFSIEKLLSLKNGVRGIHSGWILVTLLRWVLLAVGLYAIIRILPGREVWLLAGVGLAFVSYVAVSLRVSRRMAAGPQDDKESG